MGSSPSGTCGYTVKLSTFEGPLDLLLHLIRREEMDIYDIPIARITQQYLEHLDTLAGLDLDTASEFLLMAATLMDIKSRMLLPRPAESAFIDQEAQTDPRQELVRRLLEYKRYREAAQHLTDRATAARRVHSRHGDFGGLPGPVVGGGARDSSGPADARPEESEGSVASLVAALQEVLSSLEERPPSEIDREILTVDGKIAELVPALLEAGDRGLNFLDLLRAARTRRAAVVTFLALLELLRQGRVRVAQERPFGPITVWAQTGIQDWGWPGRD